MGHGDGQAGLVGEALQLALPQPQAHAVAAAAIGGDDQALGFRVARPAELVPPTPDALDREGRRVGIHADADPTRIGGEVVDAIGRDLAQLDRLPHRGVDVGELGVAVGMARALPGLPVGLAAVAQLT